MTPARLPLTSSNLPGRIKVSERILICILALATVFAPCVDAVPSFGVVYSWQLEPTNPAGDLVLDADGNLYGTTLHGGGYDVGTIFKVAPDGVLTKLVQFTGSGATNRGSRPEAGLILGDDGNFYGTTTAGGVNNDGTVFKMTPAGELTTLVDFSRFGPGNKGVSPSGGLVLGKDGNFYGTTSSGGSFGNTPGNPQETGFGTVFKMTPDGVLTTLVEFTDNGATNKGSGPLAGLRQGSDGDFYGTTFGGGANGYGTVFKMTPAGVLTTLVEFTNNGATNKGRSPQCALVEGTDGSFYGTTNGGAGGYGTVFKVTPAGVLTTLGEFTGFNGAGNKGADPRGDLVLGSDGYFYGLASDGGASQNGTVFKVTSSGGLTTVANFTGRSGKRIGSRPLAGLIKGGDGAFYGTTFYGGGSDRGTVFKVTPAGVVTNLVEFSSNLAGENPLAAVVQGSDGNFYGTTLQGGASDFGTVFQVTPAGVLTTLVNFTGYGATGKGRNPQGALVRGTDGNFYGTTYLGGSKTAGIFSKGTVFRMTPAGVLTTLVEFSGNLPSNNGAYPTAGLIRATDGNFYGTTYAGGNGFGTVFKMTLDGTLTTLVKFTNSGSANRGANPQAALVQGSDGNFYGTTASGGASDYGTVFKMTPAGALTTLVEFAGNLPTNNGSRPEAALVQGSDGNFYGTTFGGGRKGCGTVFRMTPAGALTVLVSFTGNGVTNKGSFPQASLLQGPDGNFYGTTAFGGKNDAGTVFRVTPTGTLTTLLNFALWPSDRGSHPRAPLIKGADNHLYSTTEDGGSGNGGTLFRLRFGPTPTTLAAMSVASTSATLQGLVNPRGFSTNVSFEFGVSPTLAGATTGSVGTIPAGTTAQSVGLPVAGLTPNSVYYFRTVAQNAENALPQRGGIRSFRTLP